MERNNHVLTCEEVYNSILSYIDKLDEKYGYEYLCSWIPKDGITVTEELLESLPTEMVVYKELNGLECALAGETGIVPQTVWAKYTSLVTEINKLI